MVNLLFIYELDVFFYLKEMMTKKYAKKELNEYLVATKMLQISQYQSNTIDSIHVTSELLIIIRHIRKRSR